MPFIKFTKHSVEAIKKTTTRKQVFYRDTVLPGFGLRAGINCKAYIIEKRTKGKLIRKVIGRQEWTTLEEARKKAHKLLYDIAMGIDREKEKQEKKIKKITLGEVFRDYMKTRNNLKANTIRDYKCVRNVYLPDWMSTPLVDITKNMVFKRHAVLGERSRARANMAMRVLRAIFNFAIERYEGSRGEQIIERNPVTCLSKTRTWYEIKRRQTVIKPHELPALVKGINMLKDCETGRAPVARDYFLFLLFTGLRREEAGCMKWQNVDFQEKTFLVVDTKNHDPHELPMSDYLFNLLKNMHEERENGYVFPKRGGKGHMIDTRHQRDKVVELSGIVFTPHDFRRTFITIAESLDMSAYVLKRLLNHRMKGDVTAGYIIMDVERLREPMQRITDFILEKLRI